MTQTSCQKRNYFYKNRIFLVYRRRILLIDYTKMYWLLYIHYTAFHFKLRKKILISNSWCSSKFPIILHKFTTHFTFFIKVNFWFDEKLFSEYVNLCQKKCKQFKTLNAEKIKTYFEICNTIKKYRLSTNLCYVSHKYKYINYRKNLIEIEK